MIKKFHDFILESSELLPFSFKSGDGILDIIRSIKSPISDSILNLVGSDSEFTEICLSDYSNDCIKYIPSRRNLLGVESYTDIKIGRFIRKLFGNKFTDREYQIFVEKFKSLNFGDLTFKILKGDDILDGYKSRFYTYDGGPSNSLMNSCMNDQLNFIKFYKHCPVSLLILVDSNDVIYGRALVWKISDKGYYMDRVYYAFDEDYHKFTNYAISNNWLFKVDNKSGVDIEYTRDGVNSSPIKMEISLSPEIPDHCISKQYSFSDYYCDIPYMDTFQYSIEGKLLNYKPDNIEYFKLDNTNGEPSYCSLEN